MIDHEQRFRIAQGFDEYAPDTTETTSTNYGDDVVVTDSDCHVAGIVLAAMIVIAGLIGGALWLHSAGVAFQ